MVDELTRIMNRLKEGKKLFMMSSRWGNPRNTMTSVQQAIPDFYEVNVIVPFVRVAKQLALSATPWEYAVEVFGLPDAQTSKTLVEARGNGSIYISLNMAFFNESNMFMCEAGMYIYANENDAFTAIMEQCRADALGVNMYANEISLEQLIDDAQLINPAKIKKTIDKNLFAHGFSKGRKQHTTIRNALAQCDRVVINFVITNVKGDNSILFPRLILGLCEEWGQNTKRLLKKRWKTSLEKLWELYISESSQGLTGTPLTATEINQDVQDHFLEDYSCACCGKQPKTRKDHKKCGRCQKIYYCDRVCQKTHWGEHKHTCEVQMRPPPA